MNDILTNNFDYKYDIKINQIHESAISLQGPQSDDCLHKILRQITLKQLNFINNSSLVVKAMNDEPIFIASYSLPCHNGYLLSMRKECTATLADLLLRSSESSLIMSGNQAKKLALYDNGIVDDQSLEHTSASEITNRFELNKLGIKKEQNILVCFSVTGKHDLSSQEDLYHDGKPIGKIVSFIYNPFTNQTLGFLKVQNECSKINTQICSKSNLRLSVFSYAKLSNFKT